MQSSFKLAALCMLTAILLFGCAEHNQSANLSSATNEEAVTTESTPDASVTDEDRILIKTANLSMDVDQVEESIHDFQTLVNRLDGHVFHYTVKNQKVSTREVQSTIDSAMLIHEIHPYAMLKVRVPVQHGDSFIQSVLGMNGTVSDFYFDENDVTETITEKKELMLADANPGATKAKSLKQQYFDKDRKEEYIRRKAVFSKMAYQTKHLWFDIQLDGLNYTSKQMISVAGKIRTPFYVRAFESLQNGWYGFSVFLTAILAVWPFILMGFVVYFAIRSRWFKRFLRTSSAA